MVEKLSDKDLQKLRQGLEPLLAKQPGITLPDIKELGEDFCKIWPKAEPIIRLLPDYLVYIPGVGSSAAAIVKCLDEAGTALAKEYCKEK